jgi:nucleoside-triphosphatase THEP1
VLGPAELGRGRDGLTVTDIDPDRGAFVFCTGRKGSGKSVLSRRLFDSFPYDRLVIDPTGDVAEDLERDGVKVERLTPSVMPTRFPKSLDESQPYTTAVFVPDMGSPTAVDDMDRALGLALRNKRTCVWIDEIGVMTSANSTPPALKRALHHGRHDQLTLIMAGPRPIAIDPLVVSQSDFVAVFALPNPRDRRRIAEEIGWPPAELDAAVHALGPFEYLWYDAKQWNEASQQPGTLYSMPPLPPRTGRVPGEPVLMT